MNTFIIKESLMPKILSDVEKRLLEAARAELLQNGPDGLNIRDIAKKCRISVGTVYNYFPSKEMLTAHVMVADWNAILSRVEDSCENAACVEDGLKAVYNGLKEFADIYITVRDRYSKESASIHFFYSRHQRLVAQLSGLIESLLIRFGYDAPAFLAKFTAETILTAASDTKYDFSEYLALTRLTLEKR